MTRLTARILVAGALGVAWPLLALDPSAAISQYRRTAFTTRNGLPQSSAEALLQGRDGWLWIGTQEGVARFDGLSFTVLDRRAVPELRHNRVQALKEDPSGTLWIGTEGGGATSWNGRYRTWGSADGLSNLRIRSFAAPDGGPLWAATDGGVFRLAAGRFAPVALPGVPPGDPVRRLADGKGGVAWAATPHGLFRLEGTGASAVPGTAFPGGILSVVEDPSGSLWLGTQSAVVRMKDGAVREVIDAKRGFPGGGGVSSLAVDGDGSLWIGTYEAGLWRLSSRGELASFRSSQGLPNDHVESLLVDHEGSLWVGMQDGGLLQLADASFRPFGPAEGLSAPVASPVLEDREGSLWVGTRGGGLDRIGRGGEVAVIRAGGPGGLPSDWVQALAEEAGGALWVGTRGGLSRLERGRVVRSWGPREGLTSPSVRALLPDPDGTLWVGTAGGGLFRLRGGTFRRWGRAEGLPDETIFALHRGGDGALWIGTNGGGLVRFDGERFTALTSREGLGNDIVNTLHEEGDGTLWIGTYGGGLCRWRQGLLGCVTRREGLPDDAVFRILDDGAGNLWVSSNRGVYSVGKADFGAVLAGRSRELSPRTYGVAEGMRNAECNGAEQPVGWRRRDGRLVFPTIEGIVTVDPAHLSRNAVPPRVVVVAVRATGRELADPSLASGAGATAAPGGLSLPPGSRNLEFQYTAPSFRSPARVRFRYQLEGFDRDWVEAGTRREAFYTNLPPGRYSFHVVAANEDGTWSLTGVRVPIRLEANAWESPWFWLVVALAGIAVGRALLRLRVGALEARERELVEEVERRTESLREEMGRTGAALEEARRQREIAEAAVRSVEEANRAKSQFLAVTSHELRTPLNAILGYSEMLREDAVARDDAAMSTDLSRIEGAGRHLLALINEILDLSKIEAGKMEILCEEVEVALLLDDVGTAAQPLVERNGNRLVVDLDGAPRSVLADPTRLRQVLLNLLGNAAKFTTGGTVRLSARRAGGPGPAFVEFAVDDTGIGIEPDRLERLFLPFAQADASTNRRFGGTGLGLAISRRLCELMGGELVASSAPGKGSTFTARLPVPPERRGDAGSAG